MTMTGGWISSQAGADPWVTSHELLKSASLVSTLKQFAKECWECIQLWLTSISVKHVNPSCYVQIKIKNDNLESYYLKTELIQFEIFVSFEFIL